MAADAALVADALAATLRPVLGPAAVEDLRRLSGGASRETWAFRVGDRRLILRRDPPGRPGPKGGMQLEAALMRAARRAGLAVAEVVVDDDGSTLGTAGLVMDHVDGESLPRRVLTDEPFGDARRVLVGQVGAFLAGLHAIDPAEVPGLPHSDVLADMWGVYDLVGGGSPVFKKTQAWLEANRPATTAPTIVHGDLRLGNLIVDRTGLAAVIDWELAHLGDPLEDLAWICVKAWRFGAAPEVAGIGSIDELVAAYEAAGGQAVDRDALHWWLVQKTLQWGLICMGQAFAHLSGAVRSTSSPPSGVGWPSRSGTSSSCSHRTPGPPPSPTRPISRSPTSPAPTVGRPRGSCWRRSATSSPRTWCRRPRDASPTSPEWPPTCCPSSSASWPRRRPTRPATTGRPWPARRGPAWPSPTRSACPDVGCDRLRSSRPGRPTRCS